MAATVSLNRSDDYVRGLYHLRYDVRELTSFTRMAFIQIASDKYNDNPFNLMARGNLDGLTEEWAPAKGGWTYSRTGLECTGKTPWFSLHDHQDEDGAGTYGAWANRGLIIRSWRARLGGVDQTVPYASIYGTLNGPASALVELNPSPGVTQLIPGDYVDALVEFVIVPQWAGDYYGPNNNLKAALNTSQNTAMEMREAHRRPHRAPALEQHAGKRIRPRPISIRLAHAQRTHHPPTTQ